jgi:hypothetical protein
MISRREEQEIVGSPGLRGTGLDLFTKNGMAKSQKIRFQKKGRLTASKVFLSQGFALAIASTGIHRILQKKDRGSLRR